MDNLVLTFGQSSNGECLCYQGQQVEPSMKIVNVCFDNHPDQLFPRTKEKHHVKAIGFYAKRKEVLYILSINGYTYK